MILYKKKLFDLEVKGQSPTTKKIWYGQASLRRSRSKRSGRKKSDLNNMSPFVRRGDIIM
jgi:hypothetical protein